MISLNPLKRVNSILTLMFQIIHMPTLIKVSIPSNGSIQFLRRMKMCVIRCYKVSIPSNGSIQFLPIRFEVWVPSEQKESQSPQTGQFNSYKSETQEVYSWDTSVSIPSNGSIQFLHYYYHLLDIYIYIVSIPSNGSIQFLQK